MLFLRRQNVGHSCIQQHKSTAMLFPENLPAAFADLHKDQSSLSAALYKPLRSVSDSVFENPFYLQELFVKSTFTPASWPSAQLQDTTLSIDMESVHGTSSLYSVSSTRRGRSSNFRQFAAKVQAMRAIARARQQLLLNSRQFSIITVIVIALYAKLFFKMFDSREPNHVLAFLLTVGILFVALNRLTTIASRRKISTAVVHKWVLASHIVSCVTEYDACGQFVLYLIIGCPSRAYVASLLFPHFISTNSSIMLEK